MKIVIDENIPYGREAFEGLGEVVLLPGRRISPEDVRDAAILIVRSITRVDAALLDNSSVRFVGTATIGEDHVDVAYLRSRGIAFSSAPGCNANSVADYISAALLELAAHYGFSLDTKSIGIVGVGNVGSRVAQRATALGMSVVLNDPSLAANTADPKYRPIAEILSCDIVSFHVPLTKTGPHATYHLVDESFLNRLKPGVIILNTSRGSVVKGAALKQAMYSGRVRACMLDVWEGEPTPDPELLNLSFIGTPHIAGYSFDGKVNGTRQIYEATCSFLDAAMRWDPAPLLPPPACPAVTVDGRTADVYEEARKAVEAVYSIRSDDAAMRGLPVLPLEQRGAYFDLLRKEYPQRREFLNTRAVVEPPNDRLSRLLHGMGFK